MHRRAAGPWRWRVTMLASIAIVGSVLASLAAQGSAGAASNKPFGVVICAPSQTCPPGSPPVVSAGSATGTTPTSPSVTATIRDETTAGAGLTIGSVNLTAPSGVSVASASLGGTALVTCSSATPAATSCIATDGSVVELRGLNVPPGGSITVSMALDTPPLPSSTSDTLPPCTATAPCQWTAAAKQSNDYNGPPGNQLNLDSGSSQLGVILSSVATCTSAKKSNSCKTTLGDGGAAGSTAGSVSITTSATGTSSGIFYESLDYGKRLDDTNECPGVDSVHDEYVSGAALNGSNARSFMVTITTTNYDANTQPPGYQAELCVASSQQFTAKLAPGSTTLTPAYGPTTLPDGSSGYAGLLPNCQGDGPAPTVNCKLEPGVVSRSETIDPTTGDVLTHTMVASFPAGFDATMRN